MKSFIETIKRHGTNALPAITTSAYVIGSENPDSLAISLTGIVASLVAGALSEVKLRRTEQELDGWRKSAKESHVRLSTSDTFSFSLGTSDDAFNFVPHKYGKLALQLARKSARNVKYITDVDTMEYKFSEMLGSAFYMAHRKLIMNYHGLKPRGFVS